MSFLGGIDLGTPASRNEQALRRELELRRTRKPHSGWGKVYRTGADLLLQHGTFYPGRDVPEQYRHLVGEVGSCYWNCMDAAEADPSLRYCEGITAAGGGAFLSHAWCLDPDGNVLDFTWFGAVGQPDAYVGLPILPYEHWSYWGVVMRPELARSQAEMPMLGRDPVAEMRLGTRITEQGEWFTKTGLNITPPATLPLLDVPYDPNRTAFP